MVQSNQVSRAGEILGAGLNSTRDLSSEYTPPKCAICEDSGWVPHPKDPGSGVVRCECSLRAIAEARIRVIVKDWKEYRDARLETFKPRPANNIRQANAIKTLQENPRGSYFLTGIYGQGKTRLLVAQYRYMAEKNERCLIRSAYDLMDELRRAEAPAVPGADPVESPVLRMVHESENAHLFIDDIEKAPARSDFRAESLFALFDAMKRRQIRLSFTSNLPFFTEDPDKDDLTKKLTDQVVSRLYQLTKIIDLGGGA